MQFLSIVALATSILSVNAGSHLHQRYHAKHLLEKRATVVANSMIQTLAAAQSSDVVAGANSGMPYQNTLVNNYTEDAKVIFWTKMNFALPVTAYNVNPAAPALIVDLPAGSSKTVSFSNSFSGAYAAVFPDTGIQAGGGFDTAWVEITTGQFGVIDVSMLPNMKSKWTSVQTDKCISDYTSCSYQCNDGSSECWTAPVSELMNCQGPGTQYDAGPNGAGPWNGGCTVSSQMTTTFTGPSN